jgi:hypothetical protein
MLLKPEVFQETRSKRIAIGIFKQMHRTWMRDDESENRYFD